MQNRRHNKKMISSLLPTLPSTIILDHKYNQRCSNSKHKHLPLLILNRSLKKYKSRICSEEVRFKMSEDKIKQRDFNINLPFNSVRLKQNIKINSVDLKSDRKIRKTEGSGQFRINDIKYDINLSVRTINTIYKPAHRYKTAILVFKNFLLLYGGLGCQKNLTWAKLNFSSMRWEIAKQGSGNKASSSYGPCSPIYGHTMVKYKEYAIVYGGSCQDQINQTTILNTTNMTVSQGSRCPYRRKYHAAVVMNDLMLVHGGVEARQTKSEMLVYSINADKWHCVQNLNMPALAGHRMVKGKNNKCVYMFGGLNAKGKSTNKLYKIKNISVDSNEMKWQQIQCFHPPQPRSFFCLEKLTNNYLVLYGGRQQNETTNQSEGVQNGVYNDTHIYNMDKKQWHRIQLNRMLDYCFGMGSTCSNGTIFIYGGSNHSRYADASISVIWVKGDKVDPWEAVLGGTDFEVGQSREISNQVIL